jgi:acyl carrier protein
MNEEVGGERALEMTTESQKRDTLSIVIECVRDTLPGLSGTTVSRETRLGDLPEWDSMVAVNLQMCLEETFETDLPAEFLGIQTTIAEISSQVDE